MAGTRDPVGEIGPEQAAARPASWVALDRLEGQQIGRYLVGPRLGGGGVASVYQAYDQVLGQTVALKLLPPNPDDATLNRFRREALMAGALRHPHIVRIFQVGTSARGGAAYLAMELVEGDSLAGLLARHGVLQPAESCNLLEPVAQALAFAHQHGIVHRDVKPGNILLRTVSPGTPHSIQLEALDHPVVPLLSDFGVARFLDAPELTSTGRTVGTPAFMAPEQCMGSREIDGRADIYALGTVLFRCVTGRLPFSGSMTQVLHAQVYEPVVIEDDLLRRLGPVAAILQRSLAKEPDNRYPDASLLARDLANAAQRTVAWATAESGGASATATLTLATLDAVPSAEPSKPLTVLVAGSPADSDAAPGAALPAQRQSPLPALRWMGAVMALVLLVALGTFGVWIYARQETVPRATPSPAQLAILAPLPSATASQDAAARVATEEGEAKQTAGSATVTPTPVPTATPLPTPTTAPTPVLSAPQVVNVVPVPLPSPTPTMTVAPTPAVEGSPVATPPAGDALVGVCADVIDAFFMEAASQLAPTLQGEFRCPTGPAYASGGSLLNFAQGFMLHLDGSPLVYVYYGTSGEWEQVVQQSGSDPPTDGLAGAPPPPFGTVWSENQRRLALGDPVAPTPTRIDGLVQVFTGGMLVGDRTTGEVYAFALTRLRL